MNKRQNKILFFFVLVFTMILSSCGLSKNRFINTEDAHFANYGIIGNDSAGLVYYQDSDNPSNIAVAMGSCTDTNVVVGSYNGSPVTEVYPGGFQNCKNLRSITLPSTIETIGTEAFAGSGLVSIDIPDQLLTISTGAFRNCLSLESVNFGSGTQVRTINDYAFANDYKLSYFPFNKLSELISIGKESFLYCISLKSVVFPSKFLTLSEYAFHDCTGLTTIYFPASITTISEYAFRGVGSNATIYFAEDQATAFGDCGISYNPEDPIYQGLINYMYNGSYIPIIFDVGNLIIDGIFKYIHPESGKYNLMKCTSGLTDTDFTITTNVEFVEDIAEDEVILMEYDDDGRTSITIPDTVEWGETKKVVGVYPSIFMGNTAVTSVSFGKNLRFIDYQAFSGCTSLRTIDLRNATSLKYIQARAFYNARPVDKSGNYNTRHSTIHIPPSVLNIGEDAFRKCKNIDKLFFDGAVERIVETQMFMKTYNTTRSFTLEYYPSAIEEVVVSGFGTISNTKYTVSGQTITIQQFPFLKNTKYELQNGCPIKITYRTNSTSMDSFEGKASKSTYTLNNLAVQIGRILINGVEIDNAGYSTSQTDGKTAVTFSTSINNNDNIQIWYRAESKLTRIADYAFYDGNSEDLYSKFNDRSQDVYFPSTLTEIGEYGFGSSIFVGGAHFSSSTLTIKKYAFYLQKCLNEVTFAENMDSLVLHERCFSLKDKQYTGAHWGRAFAKIILPQNTRVEGNEIFYYQYRMHIYCINNLPENSSAFPEWARFYNDKGTNYNAINYFANTGKGEPYYYGHSYLPVHVVGSRNDIVSIPSEKNPVYTFAKPKGTNYAVLGNFDGYGLYVTDENQITAAPYNRQADGNNDKGSDYTKNPYFDSEYLSLLNITSSNGGDLHYEATVPSKVSFDSGNSFVDVKEIGDQAFAYQLHVSGNRVQSNATYWNDLNNVFTVTKIHLPNSIERIGDRAFAICPVKEVYSYDSSDANTSLSNNNNARIPNNSTPENLGYLPSSLTYLGKASFVYNAFTQIYIPNGLTTFGGVSASTAVSSITVHESPFQGCFRLSTLEFYNVAGVSNPTFTASSSVVSYTSQGSTTSTMIAAGNGVTTAEIPWGVSTVAAGALRGCRKIETLTFPYTTTSIPNYFIDCIDNVYDNDGIKNDSNLVTVNFGSGSDYGKDNATKTQYPKSLCTSINPYAFNYCQKLKNMEIPNSLTTISTYAFYYCTSLDNITVDQGEGNSPISLGSDLDFTKTSIKTLGSYAFQYCSSLTSVKTNSKMGSVAYSAFRYCTSLTTADLNEKTITINQYSFGNCTSLATLNINAPKTSTLTINKQGLVNCTSLTSINIPNDCKLTLNEQALYGCTGLTKLTVPEGSTFNTKALQGCTGLAYTAGSQNGIVIGENCTFKTTGANSAFYGCSSSTRIYLKETASSYIAAGPGASKVRFPNGWNYYSDTAAIAPYLYAETAADKTEPTFKYWHYVDGVPTAW